MQVLDSIRGIGTVLQWRVVRFTDILMGRRKSDISSLMRFMVIWSGVATIITLTIYGSWMMSKIISGTFTRLIIWNSEMFLSCLVLDGRMSSDVRSFLCRKHNVEKSRFLSIFVEKVRTVFCKYYTHIIRPVLFDVSLGAAQGYCKITFWPQRISFINLLKTFYISFREPGSLDFTGVVGSLYVRNSAVYM